MLAAGRKISGTLTVAGDAMYPCVQLHRLDQWGNTDDSGDGPPSMRPHTPDPPTTYDYNFGGLTPGDYKVRFTAGNVPEKWWDNAPTMDQATIITLPDNTDITNNATLGDGQTRRQTFRSLSPARVLDSRDTAAGAFDAGTSRSVTVTGTAGVPATGVGAVAVNITAVHPTAEGHLRVWPHGDTMPNASTLNFLPGQVIANQIIAKVGTDGETRIYNDQGASHVIVDIVGWYG